MNLLENAVSNVVEAQIASGKPLAIIMAGHNGSGKSTLWSRRLAPSIQIPLINADRMMMSILPELLPGENLPAWASSLRDKNQSWMKVAQRGVQAFVAQALDNGVPFAMETVFSHWLEREDGTVESKIDQIIEMQAAGYFVILFFVGLANAELSIARVLTRVAAGGHAVPTEKLRSRFPKTQKAIANALSIVDAAILVDNSRKPELAFTVCRVQIGNQRIFDCREDVANPPPATIRAWLDVVAPDLANH